MKWRPILDFSHLVHTAQVNPRPETYGPHAKFPPHVHFSQSAKKESFRNILITINLEKSERRHFCSLSTPRSRRWSYHDGKLNYYCNSFACFQLQRYAICIGNSMICSDIWHKYHEWYFEIWDNLEISRVVFMPNITNKSCYYLFILLPTKGL